MSKKDKHPELDSFIQKIIQRFPTQVDLGIKETDNTAVMIATSDDNPRLLVALARANPKGFELAFKKRSKQGSLHLSPSMMLCNPVWSDTGAALLKVINEENLLGLEQVKSDLRCD